ncbi:hypothetical protein BKH27_10160 [Actinomyces oris]|uniref:Uncharacterized protein n=1 Tax=Actinomyces oris TaxID=544580 RepID=A0A1Q8VVB1_9ACTO|nr:hypothetical protein BKH27_10160 [Actinomyces oris]
MVGLAFPMSPAWRMLMPGSPASACWGCFKVDARSLAASTFVVTALLTLAGMRVKAAATSSSRRLALLSRPLRFLAEVTTSVTSLDRRVAQEDTSALSEAIAQPLAVPKETAVMIAFDVSLPMMSAMASRTMSCTMRTITEASVSPPEIAPASWPVMRRWDAEPAWRDLKVATAKDS